MLVELTRGLFAMVDDGDFDLVSSISWQAQPKGGGGYYAVATISRAKVYMHRMLLAASPDDKVDHINGDGLDNRRENIRLCAHSQNLRNRGKNKNNKVGFKGVCWDMRRERFRAAIVVNGKQFHLGYFHSPHDAAVAYDIAAVARHGEFAKLNFPAAVKAEVKRG